MDTQKPQKIPLGKLSDLLPGKAKYLRLMGKDLVLVNTGDGVRGYVNFCTHMGGKLRCIGARFQCSWHGAEFVCKTGEAVAGTQAPEGSKLETLEIVAEGDDLFWMYAPKKNPWALD